MVNQIDRNSTRDTHAQRETSKFTSPSASAKPTKYQSAVIDDVISSLANAQENRRARQVNEWEKMRQQYFRASA